ncbi:hypothetical protein B0H13DRAFT_2355847 [Mycena leptocephala]|nr:hypothetical protein B0H13DRAFT_2355847 [Mycena leptocephala]
MSEQDSGGGPSPPPSPSRRLCVAKARWERAVHGARSEFLPSLASGLFLALLAVARRGVSSASFIFSFLFLPSLSLCSYHRALKASATRDTEEGDVGPMLLGGGSAHEVRDEWGIVLALRAEGPVKHAHLSTRVISVCVRFREGGYPGSRMEMALTSLRCVLCARMQAIRTRYGRSMRVSGWLMMVRRDLYARGLRWEGFRQFAKPTIM